MGSDEVYLWVLRELADEVAKPPSIISEKLRQSSEVPAGWMITLKKSCGQQLDVQVEISDEWRSSGVSIGMGAV